MKKIIKKIEKFLANEKGSIKKEKLLAAGIFVSLFTTLQDSKEIDAKTCHASSSESISDSNLPSRYAFCHLTTTGTTTHASDSDHGSWIGGHASCNEGLTNSLPFAAECYSHQDIITPTPTDGVIEARHTHNYHENEFSGSISTTSGGQKNHSNF